MDWIEQLWGVTPDGGDGSIERVIAIVVIAALAAIASLAIPGRRLVRAFPRLGRRPAPRSDDQL